MSVKTRFYEVTASMTGTGSGAEIDTETFTAESRETNGPSLIVALNHAAWQKFDGPKVGKMIGVIHFREVAPPLSADRDPKNATTGTKRTL